MTSARESSVWRSLPRRLAWVTSVLALVALVLVPAGAPMVVKAAIAIVAASCTAWAATAAARADRRSLRALANVLTGLRQGDFTLRSARPSTEDDWGMVTSEANALADTLMAQRLGAIEANALLRKVMAEIDVAVFAFDDAGALVLINRAGEQLIGRPREQIEGAAASELGLGDYLEGPAVRTVELAFTGASGRGEVRRGTFRQAGRRHTLVVVSDLSRALRQEEIEAWRRLVRVLSHEINNSLTPIASIAGSLRTIGAREVRPADYDEDLLRGLELISGRAESLRRFMASYARLARLPAPDRCPLDVGGLVERVAAMTPGVEIAGGPSLVIDADPDQLEQLLLNLLTNAHDAIGEVDGGTVTVSWGTAAGAVLVVVRDDGPGLSNPANLFVPFFSTKPGGSGIGLALCRQIAESHGGTITLRNREDTRGCEAIVRLPTGT